jgi:TPR repeat protein
MLFDGTGIAQDRAQAVTWYRKAADRGHARAMNLLGRCYEEGWGCSQDRRQAADWYRRSAESGYFRAQFNHACVLLEQGDIDVAAHWLGQAASLGNDDMRREIRHRLTATADPRLLAVLARI